MPKIVCFYGGKRINLAHYKSYTMSTRNILFSLLLLTFYNAESQGLKMKLTEHTGNVESVAYSPDGKYLASGGWDGKVLLYTIDSLGNATLMSTLSGHMDAIVSLNFSKNNKYLVSASKDYSARVWNIDTPSKSKAYNIHAQPVTNAFLDASNKFLLTCSHDGTIKVTSRSDGKSRTIQVGSPINDMVVTMDNRYYLVAVKGNLVKQYETGGRNEEVATYTGHADEVNAVEVSPDGNFMASASSDKTIMIWDLVSGKSTKKLQGFEWKVTSLKYSVDGKYIVGGCNNGVAKLFETETGKSISDFNTLGKNVRDVAFSKGGKEIAVATHMEGDKWGAVIYDSGVVSGNPPQVTINKAKPAPKGKGKPAARPAGKPAAKKPGTNGSK
jgi:WD40 repeat protein